MRFIYILKKKLPAIIAFMVILICTGLIIETLLIYSSGTGGIIYSRDIAKKGLGHFLVPILLLFVFIVLVAIWHVPAGKKHIGAELALKSIELKKTKMHLPLKIYIFLYLAGFILIAAGIWNGGLNDVLIKAINICTECIGLG